MVYPHLYTCLEITDHHSSQGTSLIYLNRQYQSRVPRKHSKLTFIVEPHAARLGVQNWLGQAQEVVGHWAARAGDELAPVGGVNALLADLTGVLRAAPHNALYAIAVCRGCPVNMSFAPNSSWQLCDAKQHIMSQDRKWTIPYEGVLLPNVFLYSLLLAPRKVCCQAMLMVVPPTAQEAAPGGDEDDTLAPCSLERLRSFQHVASRF